VFASLLWYQPDKATGAQRVGWYMSEKKIKQLGWEAFVEFAKCVICLVHSWDTMNGAPIRPENI
jgi:hypothetical protein